MSQASLLMGGALIAVGAVMLDPDRMNEVLHRIISALGLTRFLISVTVADQGDGYLPIFFIWIR